MRIANVITLSDPIGGAQVHVRDLSEGLIKKGHECEVFIGAEGILTDWLKERAIRYHVVPNLSHSINPLNDYRARKALTEMLAQFKPDIVSTHSSKAGVVGRMAARKLGIPSVYTAHGWCFLDTTGPLTSLIGWRAEVHCAKFTSRIITVSESDRKLAIAKGLCDPEKIVTVHNGIGDVSEELRAHPGEEADLVNLVMVARFMAQKDHESLIRSVAAIKDRNFKLTLVGDGPLEDSAKSLVNELKLGDKVVFYGATKSVLDILQSSHIYVLATISEGLPISIIEAMRAGLPVVSNRLAGIPEQVEEGRNGFLVDVKDVEGMADRLARLIDSHELRAQMGEESRKLYLERFTSERVLENTCRVFEQILAER